jgi:pseudouridine-5'-phosphate glycosidase
MPGCVEVAACVKSALNCNKPVVALESCVITHGLPSPENVKVAQELQEIVRKAGAEPATIAVVAGKIRVGLTDEEMSDLAGCEALKLAARDLPYAVAKGLSGGTTVSATAQIAAVVGIPVVCTGGIGGAHFGSSETGDVSADLWELTPAPVVVVCAGPKAVVDAAKTAEWLETHSVPVYGYQTDELPAFYAGSSGITIPRIQDAKDFAAVVRVSRAEFGVRCAMVLAVPIAQQSTVEVNTAVRQALKEATEKGIAGKDATPYLLERVSALTKGASLQSNIALLKSNASVASEVACALYDEQERRVGFST